MYWGVRRKRRSTTDSLNEVIQKVVNDDPKTTEVILKGCSLQPEVLTSLAMALISNTHVKVLFLASVNMHSHGAQILASALIQNETVEHVWLDDNRICSIGAESFATVLHVNKSIKSIGLGNNMIGNDGALKLLSAMGMNTTVQSVRLEGNFVDNRLIERIKQLASINARKASIESSNSTPEVSKRDIPCTLPNGSSQLKGDQDDVKTIASGTTLETIIEEPESDDESSDEYS
eukprot:CCRYP_009111-RA/>CCRYP_009111-RA protein AED:0.00 eAED:0.00 QI:564/1/1/1/1/1/2/1711/232